MSRERCRVLSCKRELLALVSVVEVVENETLGLSRASLAAWLLGFCSDQCRRTYAVPPQPRVVSIHEWHRERGI